MLERVKNEPKDARPSGMEEPITSLPCYHILVKLMKLLALLKKAQACGRLTSNHPGNSVTCVEETWGGAACVGAARDGGRWRRAQTGKW